MNIHINAQKIPFINLLKIACSTCLEDLVGLCEFTTRRSLTVVTWFHCISGKIVIIAKLNDESGKFKM